MPLPEHHWLPRNHLEVLEGHPERLKSSLVRRYFYPAVWGACGIGGSVFMMFALKKPLLSGLHVQLGAISAFTAGGEIYGRLKEKYYAEEEARLKYYVQTHPDQFPDYEMIKLGDILEPWTPVR